MGKRTLLGNLCKSLSGDRSAEHGSAGLPGNSRGAWFSAPQFWTFAGIALGNVRPDAEKRKGLMSEFKFLCPECGQKILADNAFTGAGIACPTCQKTITIPATAPATVGTGGATASPPPLPQTAARPASPVPAAAGRPQQTPDVFSALAAASLICSVFVPLGSIPGIIFGHLAKARMRRNIFLVGEKMADAGLLISYGVLLATLAVGGIFLFEYWHCSPVKVMRESPAAIAALQPRIVDEVIMGENEDDHDVDGQMHYTSSNQGKSFHSAVNGGSFSYMMKVLPHDPMTLNCRYSGGDRKDHIFDIAVDDQIIATVNLKAIAPRHFYDLEYKIPASLTRGKTQVKVEFQAHAGKTAGGLYACQTLK
jgi:DNA-directed RNA polymerase subunit RPC12/RpoP